MDTLRGLVVRSQSGFYTVQTDQSLMVCQLRGRLKQGPREGDVVALGDWVKVTPLDEEVGIIEEIEERERMLSRMAPTPGGEYEQIIIANPDQCVFIFACQEPAPRFGMLDRFLIIAEERGIPGIILVNKIDLVGLETAEALFGHYALLDYPVIY
ncbi:MAG: GTPase RsgA, partial [Anaerolineales bacterium]